ncbi:NAD(P)/FAD-dependent oxidoreductase [Cecembia rubra]|uniref:NAD(P)/FAD-dependent oxidoreductase n=1 Tax=Cecembia rubra TaxID=1485585 RepID=UPI00271476EE|nr:FAD/NAD(P)-binding oxidoreductase [Cecembia rubra]
MNNRKIVIIGNGISGITCARNIRKKDKEAEILVISGETEHFFSRTALMYIYMGHMKYEHTKPYEDWFWEKNRIKLLKAWIEFVDFPKKQLICQEGKAISYDILILATGSRPNKIGWPGQDLKGVQGLYSFQDLELMEENTKGIKKAVIVGGGLIGIEMAEMLRSRNVPVTFLVRERNFWDNVLPEEEAKMINKHILEHEIDLQLDTQLDEIIGDDEGRVTAVVTNKGKKINCEFVGLTVGVVPNIGFLIGSGLETSKGILIDHFFRTNMPNVYAIGDCAEFRELVAEDRKNIEQVWYTGRMHGETLAHNLTSQNQVPYMPGPWFNSAKFLDIEYQTYGQVPPKQDSYTDSFFWNDAKGKVSIRLNYNKDSNVFMGVNALGWRLRHDFFDRALTEKWTIDQVMGNLDKASFNPEFYKPYYQAVLKDYNSLKGNNIQFKKVSLFRKLIGSRA